MIDIRTFTHAGGVAGPAQDRPSGVGQDGPPGRRGEVATDPVYLLFTSVEETLAAVPVACSLARALGSRLTILHVRPIAFGAPLESPVGLSPVQTEGFLGRLGAQACDAKVAVWVCRDARSALSSVLARRSLVLLGRRRRWWPSSAAHWRHVLESAGHLVAIVDEGARA